MLASFFNGTQETIASQSINETIASKTMQRNIQLNPHSILHIDDSLFLKKL